MNLLSSLNRSTLLSKLSAEEFDLLIIGGGITGAGIALDAASRGIKTVLIEKQDLQTLIWDRDLLYKAQKKYLTDPDFKFSGTMKFLSGTQQQKCLIH